MRRHDLVYLRPGAGFDWSGPAPISPAVRTAVAAWIAAGRPLVAARQPASSPQLLLGLALPLAIQRQRVTLLVDPAAVAEIRPPLSLAACLVRQPAALREVLLTLERALHRAGSSLGAYGSLAWEALSGEAYRHAESDIDLICDIADRAQLETALELFADAAAALPCRLDGEIRLPGGTAIAWRELAAAWEDVRRSVLVKDEQGVALKPLGELLALLVPYALAA
jgi:phosphoribosyl-dephospho-CoA transferase